MGILLLFQPRVRDLRSHVSVTLHSAQLILWLLELLMVQGTWKEKKNNLRRLRIVQCCCLHCQLRAAFLFNFMKNIYSLLPSLLLCLPDYFCSVLLVSRISPFSQCQLWARNSLEHWLYSSKQDRHILPLRRLNSCLLHMSLKPFFPHDSPV